MSGFALADHGAIDGHAMRNHISDLQGDHMAATQLAVDGSIEHSQIPDALLNLKFDPDRPDVLSNSEQISFPLFHGVRCASSGFPNGPLGTFVSSVCRGASAYVALSWWPLRSGFRAFRA